MSKWPPDGPIRPKKRNNPGLASLPRVPKHKQRLKHFIGKVFDKDKPLIKKKEEVPATTTIDNKTVETPPSPKVKKEKEPKDKTKYKWEEAFHTDTRKKIWDDEAEKRVKNPDYGVTRQRGKTKGPGSGNEGTTKWKISSWGKDKANYHQPDYPGVRKKKVTTTRNKEDEWEQKETTRYKRSHSGYLHLSRRDKKTGEEIEGTYKSFPSRKELKAFNKESEALGEEGFRAVRKEKSYHDLWGMGTMKQKKKLPAGKDSYVKTYYRGKLKPKITYY